MITLPDALRPMAEYPQFILYKLVPGKRDPNKLDKLPVDHRTLQVFVKGQDWQQDPNAWTTAQNAINMVAMCGPEYGVGFFFTAKDPFFFIDLDKCLNPDDTTWSPVAMDVMSKLPGAAIEVSQSGRGLHIFAKGISPAHGCKNIPLGLEMYTEGRFVALTGTNAVGDAGLEMSAYLPGLVAGYFPLNSGSTAGPVEWTEEPVSEWTPLKDEEILAKALTTQSASAVFGGKSNFQALWEGDEDILSASYADESRSFDASSADAALAQHLAFWTGKNCDHILRLMKMSGLVRDKWEREDYLIRTITRAVSLQEGVYSIATVDTSVPDAHGACKLRGSDAQRTYADGIRAQKMAECGTDTELCKLLAKIPAAKTWLDNQDKTGAEIASMVTTVDKAANPLGCVKTGPELVNGYQYLGATQQLEYFEGCVYIQDIHRIFTPSGALLKSEQFNATFGGYSFQLDESGTKVTRKAWEAFTESQIIRYPKAVDMCFRPDLEPGALIEHEGRVLVNTYVPVETRSLVGDVTPFLSHLAKLLPNENDRAIMLAYMAACVQHKGVKFQWAPLIQGTEGNGKTLLTRCVAFAIGEKYTHFPPATEMAEKFNAWLFTSLFIGIEDVYVPDHKKEILEVLKPMITNDRLAKRAMNQDPTTHSVCANFMLNSNHKDAIRKTENDRRFAVFYSNQQEHGDLTRDKMDGDYFPKLYKWLRAEGYAMISNYLSTYHIPEELNPAGNCHRAPITSSTHEAITSSMGGVEQEIIEAIEEGRPGFAGGWISSVAVERLLQGLRMGRAIPHNKRRDLLKGLGYDWHPALNNGRVNNAIPMDDGKKPRLFIKIGHVNCNITEAAIVAKTYQDNQGGAAVSTGSAATVFAPKATG